MKSHDLSRDPTKFLKIAPGENESLWACLSISAIKRKDLGKITCPLIEKLEIEFITVKAVQTIE